MKRYKNFKEHIYIFRNYNFKKKWCNKANNYQIL
jgi:hypothetical protein